MDHEAAVTAMQKEIDELKADNVAKDEVLRSKEALISETRGAVKELSGALQELQRDAEERAQRIHAVFDVLYKVQGDTVLKLKYGKMSRKTAVFVSGLKQLFYYDEGGNNKSEQKYIEVVSVSADNSSIDKQMDKAWFLVTGRKRVALFAADDAAVRDKWVKFLRESLDSASTKASSKSGVADDDDRKED